VNNPLDWHKLCSLFSRRITDTLFRLPENREKIEVHNDIEFFRGMLHLKEDEVLEWIEKALADTNLLLAELNFPCNVEQSRALLRKASERVLDLLSSQDSLTKESKLVEGKTPVEIFQQVLRHFHDKFGFDRTLLCLASGGGSPSLVAVAGVGRNANQIASRFRCQGAKPDIFRIVLNKKVDLYVADTHAPTYAKYIPDWYAGLGACSCMLLTLVSDGQPVGMLYGDYAELHPDAPQGIATEACVKEWREQLQAVLQSRASTGA